MYYTWVKEYYEMGLYTIENLETFVNVGMITAEQKKEILNSKAV